MLLYYAVAKCIVLYVVAVVYVTQLACECVQVCLWCIFSCVMYMRVYNEPRFMAMMCYKVILLGCFAPLYIWALYLNVVRIYMHKDMLTIYN